ncbi:MAG: VRR-NUC domain-containing protein [Caulobacter sp.]|nr:VRR-NUC domain-containing protein [Caulobacter sp.]
MIRHEENLHRQVASYLNTIPGLLWWTTANQRGTRSRAEMGVLKDIGVRPGVPDVCLLIPGGKIGFIELKAPKGRMSESQLEFTEAAKERGALVAVCYSLEDVTQYLNGWLGPYGYRIPRIAA